MDLLRTLSSTLSKLRALLSSSPRDLALLSSLQTSLQSTLTHLWTSPSLPAVQHSPHWKTLVDLLASGRIPATAAQADDLLKGRGRGETWVADGRAYAQWLGGGVARLARREGKAGAERLAELLGRALWLGYVDELVAAVVEGMVLEKPRETGKFQRLVGALKAHERRRVVLSVLGLVGRRYFPAGTSAGATRIAGAAALLNVLVEADEGVAAVLSAWLVDGPNAAVQVYRAVVAALPGEEGEKALESVWMKWADGMVVRHAGVVVQDSLARILLLLAGKVHRSTPMAVYMHGHSSFHTGGVSARLGSSSPRIRFLGMAVGVAVSRLVDKPETRMKFEFDEEDERGFEEMNALVEVDDHVGSLDDLPEDDGRPSSKPQALTLRPKQPRQHKPKTAKPVSKIQVIESDESNSDDDLTPYAKPDSDPADSDDDPTLVQRKKPKPPVYIRDLITQLSNTDDAEIQHLALTTAPSLIRRKADFGTELSDRAIGLCSTYFNLSDPFGFDDFLQLRLHGMLALLVAQPKVCGPYFATLVFDGEFNIGQRVAGLTAMGLAARELAGYKTDESSEEQFPSTSLPERLHKLYLQDSEMDHLSKQLESSMLRPVSTTQKRQRRIIRNDLSKIVAEGFFFPLTGSFAARVDGLPSARHVLPTLVRTLAILLVSAGPSTVALPQLTAEMFALLLSLRTRAGGDSATLEAVLFGFLSVLNVNEDKRALAERQAREIVEVHEWCNPVFERLNEGLQGVDAEEERMKTLCAGVLVATKEVIESYERLMVGELVDFGR